MKRVAILPIATLLLSGFTLAGAALFQSCGSPTHHTVDLSWHPPAAAAGRKLAGYNVYRSATAGGPFAEIASGLHESNFTDRAVKSKATYFYVVTAIDNAGSESRFSNEVEATIP